MPEDQKPPIVIYGLCDPTGTKAYLRVGYLGTRDGNQRCFIDEEMTEEAALPNGHFERLEDITADREIYLFQPIRDAFQQVARPGR